MMSYAKDDELGIATVSDCSDIHIQLMNACKYIYKDKGGEYVYIKERVGIWLNRRKHYIKPIKP